MSEWSETAAEKFLKKEKARTEHEEKEAEKARIRDEKIIQDRKILEKRAPELWNELVGFVKNDSNDFNKGVGQNLLFVHLLNPWTLTLKRVNLETVVSFDKTTFSIKLTGPAVPATNDKFVFRVPPGESDAKLFTELSGVLVKLKSLSEKVLDDLIQH